MSIAFAQQAASIGSKPTGFPDDWTHHHVIFSNPGSDGDATATGTLKRWTAIAHDPRYVIQQAIRNATSRTAAAPDLIAADSPAAEFIAAFGTRNRRDVKQDWSMDMGSGATVGAGQYPAKFSFSTSTANCASSSTPDFAVYNTSLAGSSTQASIVAFFNLYTGCSTSTYQVPNVYWAYNTGGTILTSVVLSGTGTQLAFIHSSGSNTSKSSLVVLHWKAGDGVPTTSGSAAASPVTLTPSTCTGSATSCENGTLFGTAANVTRSAPYYDYSSDALYVGDDLGVLHKFTTVFTGTPSEVITGGWPVTVHTGDILTSPVFDYNTKNIFVGDSSGRLSYVRDTGSTTGTCGSGSPPCLGSTTQTLSTGPIADAPLIDPSQGTVYAFSGVTNGIANYEVLQTNESLNASAAPCSGGTCPSITFTGKSGRTYTSYARMGAFDNTYYTSGPSSGHLYFCAPDLHNGNLFNGASLYRLSFSGSGVLSTSTTSETTMVSASDAAGTVDDCSPLTEFYNGTTDYLFVGVDQNGNLTGCTGTATAGCVYNFNITSSLPSNSVAGLTVTGNSSGIVIDNNVTTPETGSQIYFTNLNNETCAGVGSGATQRGNGSGGCAIQASQAALQ